MRRKKQALLQTAFICTYFSANQEMHNDAGFCWVSDGLNRHMLYKLRTERSSGAGQPVQCKYAVPQVAGAT